MSSPILFVNARVFDSTGAAPFDGQVLVKGARIAAVSHAPNRICEDGKRIVDCGGAMLMSGLCDAHVHMSWINQESRSTLRAMPIEEHVLACVRNARTYLDCGFTMSVSAAAAQPRLDIVIRDAIDRGDIPGPRCLANGPIVTSSRDFGESQAQTRHFADVEIIEDEGSMRRCVQRLLQQPVDLLKLTMSGEAVTGVDPHRTLMDDEEVAVAVEEACKRGVRVCAHARSAESIKICVRQGVEIIYHASYADDEALDMLEASRNRFFVAPGVNWLYTTAYEAEPWGITAQRAAELGYPQELEAAIKSMQAMHRRGIRVLPGGDYGFAWCPHGTYARDLAHFTGLLGFTPMEALVSATRLGGEIMGRAQELGQVLPGYLADLILVDGDPLQDISLMQDRRRIVAVMKGGAFHKEPPLPTAGATPLVHPATFAS